MKKNHNTRLLSEILRPQTFSDLIVTETLRKRLENISKNGWVMNATFYGSPGIGKTTAVRLINSKINADQRVLNGSLSDGDKTFVRSIEIFASCSSFEGRPKVLVIEEADKMSKNIQESLRYVIENTSDHCRYLLTVNDLSKITDAIKSRCIPICFDVPRREIDAVIERAVKNYKRRLKKESIEIDGSSIEELIKAHFPDFRTIANYLQIET